MDIRKVLTANFYRSGAMGSLGDASYMLLRQFQFPDTYSSMDSLTSRDSDRLFQQEYQHATRCFKEHTGRGELAFETWLHRAFDGDVIKFLTDILKADPLVRWTGYRVTGSVHRGNGHAIFHFELFAKHPTSHTEVYTGSNAPNVVERQQEEGIRTPSRW
ncbi:MAG: hypothetical protein A2675_02860 [Candidatus Yonathbacteria bacterium RIFCSPHIGHO2_01_FULL_51_10]|uniref:Uncharacterized protein n=1 Tax=Candidatus Yonathbacteria bacterium RIFCSPHIGHO2_01_FULL_51_10 TaxID=1802723 RepID=A0A1G2S9A5_9BACT|nr:MAG: hypothetical protein A2675_02860 [Candidatus Yonathbacteria bacterium RIFCSPHIGHO2_01_FULL_51_10]